MPGLNSRLSTSVENVSKVSHPAMEDLFFDAPAIHTACAQRRGGFGSAVIAALDFIKTLPKPTYLLNQMLSNL